MAGVLDAELNGGINNYVITVKASDPDSNYCTGTIQVDINDVNEFAPVFAQTFEDATVTEGASVDTRYSISCVLSSFHLYFALLHTDE